MNSPVHHRNAPVVAPPDHFRYLVTVAEVAQVLPSGSGRPLAIPENTALVGEVRTH